MYIGTFSSSVIVCFVLESGICLGKIHLGIILVNQLHLQGRNVNFKVK